MFVSCVSNELVNHFVWFPYKLSVCTSYILASALQLRKTRENPQGIRKVPLYPSGSSPVHIYTQTIQRTTQWEHRTPQWRVKLVVRSNETLKKGSYLRRLFDRGRSDGSEEKISVFSLIGTTTINLLRYLNTFIVILLCIIQLWSELLHVRNVFNLATRQFNDQTEFNKIWKQLGMERRRQIRH
jgi:hypothetical protein